MRILRMFRASVVSLHRRGEGLSLTTKNSPLIGLPPSTAISAVIARVTWIGSSIQ